MLYENISTLIGCTPLLSLNRYARRLGLHAHLMGKLEAHNPGGSVKDRLALALLDDAQKRGILTPETTMVEPTSGNTGIGLACLCATRGYRLILTMPETMSLERRKLLKAYGAELVLTEGALGMKGAVAKAEELVKEIPNAFIPGQFSNPANPQMHYATTGPEIWHSTQNRVDIFVAGIGTGGTITGAGRFLREMNPALHIAAVEPAASPLLSQGRTGPHKIQGIGAGFVPQVLDTTIYQEVIAVEEADAIAAACTLARTEGLLPGISGGAALHAATLLARRPENAHKHIALILPDAGERYLSMEVFS
ncbi:MAG: cysteine synthase A [Defluviitaleaceae bacterium]|nr:cysteine synthase A [Defluviitaleaceae bacterium]MCL2239708.1 cysteine synthase A [Defluviitaleaceae bacterium]